MSIRSIYDSINPQKAKMSEDLAICGLYLRVRGMSERLTRIDFIRGDKRLACTALVQATSWQAYGHLSSQVTIERI